MKFILDSYNEMHSQVNSDCISIAGATVQFNVHVTLISLIIQYLYMTQDKWT